MAAKKKQTFEEIGCSRDDACGEAFDKVGRVMGLPYPGGAAMDRQISRPQEQIKRAMARLNALNPSAVLERGYALVMDGDRVITSAKTANDLNQMTLRFHDGSAQVERRK